MVAENSAGTAGSVSRGRPFAKGQSGNPGGRPKQADSPRAELRRILQLIDESSGKRNSTRVAEMLLAAALKGNIEAIKYVFDRVDGKPVEAQPALADERPVTVNINGVEFGKRQSDEPAAAT
jgi:hypothetical protein